MTWHMMWITGFITESSCLVALKLAPYLGDMLQKPSHNDSSSARVERGLVLSRASIEYGFGRLRSAWCMSIQYPVDCGKREYDTNTHER
jgi:hypothetical protein